jgi:hypothetical protein
MTQIEFVQLQDAIKDLTPDQLRLLREAVDQQLTTNERIDTFIPTPDELAEQQLQKRLFDAGLLSEIKPPSRMWTGVKEFDPIEIEGELLSETIIRERR